MTKIYTVTIRGRHGEMVDTRTVECTEGQDPAEMAVGELDEDTELDGIHVSGVSEVV